MGYPQQPPPPPPPPAGSPNDRTTLFGILGIVGALCCAPLGVLFGLLSLMEARRNRTKPTLAYVAFGIAALSVLLNIIWVSTGNSPYSNYMNR
jgi:hypothetical protein